MPTRPSAESPSPQRPLRAAPPAWRPCPTPVTWFPARALDNTLHTVLANHTGHTGGRHACGGSAVWGPDGRLIAEASEDRRELVVVDLDLAVLRTTRETEPLLADLALATGRPPAPRARLTLA
ncbi:nitrilase-related carbon-nitrogen hydrolase [Kitasatospora sp. NPDC101235]|uniref:nitrilase-related carbon-nitrogen hydrolase n=1 Tax=Kitasatospora sp. NPDC101235 TaxID=3364101 RepID=UPI003818AFAB